MNHGTLFIAALVVQFLLAVIGEKERKKETADKFYAMARLTVSTSTLTTVSTSTSAMVDLSYLRQTSTGWVTWGSFGRQLQLIVGGR